MNRSILAGAIAALLLLCATPTQARFYQADPAGYKDDLNLYTYVGNDPTDKTDPSGLYGCAGNKKDCGTINKFVKAINSARANYSAKSSIYQKLTAISEYLGTAGDGNGVTLAATSLNGRVSEAGANNTINVDVTQARNITNNGLARGNPGVSRNSLVNAQGGERIGHEVRHELDAAGHGWPTNWAQEFQTETNAYDIGKDIYGGLGVHSGLDAPGAVGTYAGKSAKEWCRAAKQQGSAPPGC